MKFLKNTAVYVALYILLMIPTYILPYFGSNSMLINAFGMAFGIGPNPQWWVHVWFIVAITVISWGRSEFCTKKWLPIFPVLAGVFDMVPMLNSIPLIPTILNICGIIFGVTLLSDKSAVIHPNFRRQMILLGGWSALTVIGIVVKLSTAANISAIPTATKAPNFAVPTQKSIEPPTVQTAPATPAQQPPTVAVSSAAPTSTPLQSPQAVDPQSKAMLNKANKTLDSLLK